MQNNIINFIFICTYYVDVLKHLNFIPFDRNLNSIELEPRRTAPKTLWLAVCMAGKKHKFVNIKTRVGRNRNNLNYNSTRLDMICVRLSQMLDIFCVNA